GAVALSGQTDDRSLAAICLWPQEPAALAGVGSVGGEHPLLCGGHPARGAHRFLGPEPPAYLRKIAEGAGTGAFRGFAGVVPQTLQKGVGNGPLAQGRAGPSALQSRCRLRTTLSAPASGSLSYRKV